MGFEGFGAAHCNDFIQVTAEMVRKVQVNPKSKEDRSVIFLPMNYKLPNYANKTNRNRV